MNCNPVGDAEICPISLHTVLYPLRSISTVRGINYREQTLGIGYVTP